MEYKDTYGKQMDHRGKKSRMTAKEMTGIHGSHMVKAPAMRNRRLGELK